MALPSKLPVANKAKASFRSRLLVGVLVPIFLAQMLGFGLNLLQLKERYFEALRLETAQSTILVGEAMVQPLWDFDMAQIRKLAEGLLRSGSVGQVVVRAPENTIMAEASAPGFVPTDTDLHMTQALVYRVGGQVEVLGELDVTIPTDRVPEALRKAVLNELAVVASVLVLVGFALFVILTKMARPLAEMTGAIAEISRGNLEVEIPGMGRDDEIGAVAKALDQMRLGEAEVSYLRKMHDERSSQERQRIRRALESTSDAVLIADESGEIVYSNPNARSVFGGTVPGAWLSFHNWLQEDKAQLIEGAIVARVNFEVEATAKQVSDAQCLFLLIRGSPILSEEGTYLGTAIIATDHTDQARQNERVRYLSEHDSLTGLPNRRLMESTLENWMHEYDAEASVLLADLDNFKRINDTLGHPIGDAFLKHVASLIEAKIGDGELAARLGGDEFAIMAYGPGSHDRLRNIALALVAELSQPQRVGGRVFHSGLSAGISTLGKAARNPADGMRRADLALYEAKRNGRGRVEIFHEDLEAVSRRKSLLEAELRAALNKGGIRPVYQVQTAIGDKRVVGFEALARWDHPTLGQVSPAEFIPVAEEAGLIGTLTYQIMTSAMKSASEWRAMGFPGRIAVNVSAALFGEDVEEFVRDCLFATVCPTDAVEVEITENVVLSDSGQARRSIEALRKLGIKVALDDFGMGYSSLSYLQSFPVDKIKIDRAFVSTLPQSSEARAIVSAIAELGHALGMTVAGEGAETEEHRELLRDCGVDFVQGFVDGLPLEQDDVASLVEAQMKHRTRLVS